MIYLPSLALFGFSYWLHCCMVVVVLLVVGFAGLCLCGYFDCCGLVCVRIGDCEFCMVVFVGLIPVCCLDVVVCALRFVSGCY